MRDHLVAMVLGMGAGAVIASLALGLVLTHRASGVINFAHAAVGMFVALTYFRLRATGDLILPVLGLPGHIHLTDRPTVALALAGALAMAVLLGLVQYMLVFRPLRHAPPLARVVASLGVMLYLVEVADLRRRSTEVRSPLAPLLPTNPVPFLGTNVPADRLLFPAAVAVVALALWALGRFTRFGLASRAAAETDRGARLTGHSPDRLAAANWVLASVLAGTAVIVAAPIVNELDPLATSLLITPALAAALLGRLDRFVLTAGAGVAIGMVQAEIAKLRTDFGKPGSWILDVDLQEGLPLVVIVTVIAWHGRRLPERGIAAAGRLPVAPWPRRTLPVGLGLAAASVTGLLTLDSAWRQGVITSTIAAVIALSVVVLTGYAGQISLAPMALAGLAAFSMVRVTEATGWPFPLPLLAGAGLATGAGALLALPAIRVRGLHLAMVTLAGAVAMEKLIFGWSWFVGPTGTRVPRPEVGGLDLGIGAAGAAYPRVEFGLLCLFVLALLASAVTHLRRGRMGQRWLAARDNERAASAAGIDVPRAKLSAFVVSSFIAGVGGTLLAYQAQSLSASSFQVLQSLLVLAIAYLAGIASVGGALAAGLLTPGGVLTTVLDHGGSDGARYQLAVSGILLVAAAVAFPQGIVGAFRSMGRPGERRSQRPTLTKARAPAVAAHGARSPVRRSTETILEADGITVGYDGSDVVREVDLKLARGEVVALLGANGAGKTTTLGALSGLLPLRAGTITASDLCWSPEHRPPRVEALQRRGLGFVPEDRALFTGLRTVDNLRLALPPGQRRGQAADAAVEQAVAWFPGLEGHLQRPAGLLSGGQQQMLALARVLVARPKVLLVDELSLGLAPLVVEHILATVRTVADETGVGVLLVEQHVSLAAVAADRAYVLERGRVVAEGDAQAVAGDRRQLVASYLGSGLGDPHPPTHQPEEIG